MYMQYTYIGKCLHGQLTLPYIYFSTEFEVLINSGITTFIWSEFLTLSGHVVGGGGGGRRGGGAG